MRCQTRDIGRAAPIFHAPPVACIEQHRHLSTQYEAVAEKLAGAEARQSDAPRSEAEPEAKQSDAPRSDALAAQVRHKKAHTVCCVAPL
jgi:hypothetical protein